MGMGNKRESVKSSEDKLSYFVKWGPVILFHAHVNHVGKEGCNMILGFSSKEKKTVRQL